MELQPYVEEIQCQVVIAAEAGGYDARMVAERLLSPLDAAIRLALQDALVAAAEEITCDLAPGSVELRLRGRDPEFVVTPAPVEASGADLSDSVDVRVPNPQPSGEQVGADADDGAMSRINLRMPDHLKGRIESAAAGDGLSVNSWLVRAATTALQRGEPIARPDNRGARGGQRYTGWAR